MYHKITVAGRLGRDPEMRHMPDGKAVTNFSIATDDGWGENKKTIWFKISVWGKRAEVANQYLQKGSSVLVEGRVRADDNGGPVLFIRNDGSQGANFEVTASDFAFLSSRSENAESAPAGGGSGGGSYDNKPVVEDLDVPF